MRRHGCRTSAGNASAERTTYHDDPAAPGMARWRPQRTFYGYSVWYNTNAAVHTCDSIAPERGFLMTIEITIQVPDTLGQQLQQLHDRLPEVLERGLRDVLAEETGPPHDEHAIIAILTSQPAPEQVLAIRPSSELRPARASSKNAASTERSRPRSAPSWIAIYCLSTWCASRRRTLTCAGPSNHDQRRSFIISQTKTRRLTDGPLSFPMRRI